LLPVITEAGGRLTDWSGNATHTAPEAIATNGRLLEAVMNEIRGHQEPASGWTGGPRSGARVTS
jgi:hypothetical protein